MTPSLDTAGTLFESLRPRLTALSRRIVGNAAEAEDVVQDCFIKWHGTDRAALATPVAWLATVVRHQSLDLLRKRVRDMAAAGGALELVPEAAPALPEADLLRRAELGEALARLLACLSPSERLALVLHEVFDCSHAEIAATVGTNAVNARQYLARARRRLEAQRDAAAREERLCRDLIRRFQAALDGRDVPALVALLGGEQPVSVQAAAHPHRRMQACANDAAYRVAA